METKLIKKWVLRTNSLMHVKIMFAVHLQLSSLVRALRHLWVYSHISSFTSFALWSFEFYSLISSSFTELLLVQGIREKEPRRWCRPWTVTIKWVEWVVRTQATVPCWGRGKRGGRWLLQLGCQAGSVSPNCHSTPETMYCTTSIHFSFITENNPETRKNQKLSQSCFDNQVSKYIEKVTLFHPVLYLNDRMNISKLVTQLHRVEQVFRSTIKKCWYFSLTWALFNTAFLGIKWRLLCWSKRGRRWSRMPGGDRLSTWGHWDSARTSPLSRLPKQPTIYLKLKSEIKHHNVQSKGFKMTSSWFWNVDTEKIESTSDWDLNASGII